MKMCKCENLKLWKYGEGRVSRLRSHAQTALAICLFAYFHTSTIAYSAPAAADVETRVEELLAKMTLDEKIGQLCQTAGRPSKKAMSTDMSKAKRDDKFLTEIRAGRYGSLIGRRGRSYNMFQQAALESRLGIPLLVGHDMIHSAKTCWPIPLGLSCAWDEDLWRRVGEAMAVESLMHGCNWTFTPMLDVALDARWGRIAEGGGSDPLVTSLMGAAMVRGIQGEDMADGRHIAACAKHFVAYGAAMGGRDYNAVEMSDDTLRDVYLPPFRAAVEAGVATVMPAFHSFNGVPCSVNRYLLTDILRGELGFDGMTISDYNAIREAVEGHGVAESGADVAAKALWAGMDMEMLSHEYANGIKDALAAGKLKMETLDNAVRRVLRVKFRLGLFEHPTIDFDALDKTIDYAAHLALARESAQKSAVLVKNGGVLPLAKGAKIALVGDVANNAKEMFGSWSGTDNTNNKNITLLAGLKADGVNVAYTRGYNLNGKTDADALKKAADEADVVVATFGEYSTENGENNSKTKIELNPAQLQALDVLKASGKPVVAVVFTGRPLAVPQLAGKADAVLIVWNPGSAGGWGVADVLTGAVEPYGRLTTDFPNASGECPKFYSRTTTGRPNGTYSQGARWSTRYRDVPFKSVWPFGFGLAYTTFAYSGESAKMEGDKVVFAADVKNTGARKGSELVQVYVRDVLAETVRPRRQLKGFKRVELAPGETKHVEIEVPVSSLGYTVNGKYRVEPGAFEAWIAPDSDSGRVVTFSYCGATE